MRVLYIITKTFIFKPQCSHILPLYMPQAILRLLEECAMPQSKIKSMSYPEIEVHIDRFKTLNHNQPIRDWDTTYHGL